jgi:hypothetical protein
MILDLAGCCMQFCDDRALAIKNDSSSCLDPGETDRLGTFPYLFDQLRAHSDCLARPPKR